MVKLSFCITATISVGLAIGCDRSPPATPITGGTKPAAKARPIETQTANEVSTRANDDARDIEQRRKDNSFIEAVRDGNLATARQLLSSGASVSARYIDSYAFLSDGQTGYTALMFASIEGNAEMVKFLLTHKPDVNYARKEKTALYFAAVKGHDEVVRLLKEAGAVGDPRRIWLTHELIRAACKGYEYKQGEGLPPYPGVVRDLEGAAEIVEVVKQGADVNWTEPEGYTPLMYAANVGLFENVRTLLNSGADATIKSKHGETALSLAESGANVNREERKRVIELLKEHLANDR